ncbi:hypothetical protein P154DRAFT_570569 [Amniculicola lignicola CBS 123094]|uniref:Uncharacterized protein n=1 Tax=Amniculicola lignicola CBS 123094 TaxID=1392246 RepID=A0A6A5WXJ5_9PLEO|nr:hypothetical protein P154DRAFT_570569 [Amniculicola lignicola CBS 123094]
MEPLRLASLSTSHSFRCTRGDVALCSSARTCNMSAGLSFQVTAAETQPETQPETQLETRARDGRLTLRSRRGRLSIVGRPKPQSSGGTDRNSPPLIRQAGSVTVQQPASAGRAKIRFRAVAESGMDTGAVCCNRARTFASCCSRTRGALELPFPARRAHAARNALLLASSGAAAAPGCVWALWRPQLPCMADVSARCQQAEVSPDAQTAVVHRGSGTGSAKEGPRVSWPHHGRYDKLWAVLGETDSSQSPRAVEHLFAVSLAF